MAVRGVDDDHVDARLAQRARRARACRRWCRPPRRRAARPRSSLQARGNSVAFWMSFTVIMPFSSNRRRRPPAPSRCGACAAGRAPRPCGASSRTVTSRSFGVMTADTGASSCVSKRRSRCVTMPTALPSRDDRHAGDVLARASARCTSRIVVSGVTVIGSWMTPLSNFFTRATSRACASDRHVLVDDADAAFLRDRDREARLGDRVHRGRHDRQVQPDAARELGAEARPRAAAPREYAGTSRTSSKVSASSRMRSMG